MIHILETNHYRASACPPLTKALFLSCLSLTFSEVVRVHSLSYPYTLLGVSG
jgi:hypothetical protein